MHLDPNTVKDALKRTVSDVPSWPSIAYSDPFSSLENAGRAGYFREADLSGLIMHR
jgi:hypothetical protein